jgi:hypothetical protein
MVVFCLGLTVFSGCATVHRYPSHSGKVYELGTDAPIEGAGVLAVYQWVSSSPGGPVHQFLGYQAVLTDKEGKFTIPSKWFSPMQAGLPFAWFESDPNITIYKQGYGNFPGSFGTGLAKRGMTEPEWVSRTRKFPFLTTVTFWLPKLETKEEIREHDSLFFVTSSILFEGKPFPPEGMTKDQYLPPKYR